MIIYSPKLLKLTTKNVIMINKIVQTRLAFRFCETMLFCALFLSSGEFSAQQVPAYGEYLNSLPVSQRESLDALVSDVQTTVFINNGQMSIGGEGNPRVLDLSISDLALVNWSSPMLTHIELIRFRVNNVNDLGSVFNLSSTASLAHLRYIIVLSTVEATSSQLSALIQGNNASVQKLYDISIPN